MELPFYYGKEHLTASIALDIAAGRRRGVLSDDVRRQIERSRQNVMTIVAGHKTVYGVNTGFGPLCTTMISDDHLRELQHNLLKSHSVGVGPDIAPHLSKLMMILKVHALAKGYSGISLATVERILWHIDREVIPCVPAQGSVGASGDLAPLAHLFLPLIGEGSVLYKGEKLPAATVLEREGLPSLELGPKEGLALINGTQFITAYAIEVLDRLGSCLDQADLIGAMSLEALLGSAKPFMEMLHTLRPYAGTNQVAARMRIFLAGSQVMESHAHCRRVQDPYSLRCIPQVHGAARNAWLHLQQMLETEINSVTDNPIVLDAATAISGGNFHGQPIAMPLDYAAFAASELGNISERRVYLLLEGKIDGLPKLLLEEIGLHSGFMIVQYTAAALASENKTLCFPASADSIPTSLGQEDHVSMGAWGGRKALLVVENLEQILAVELLCAAQGLDFRRPLASSPYIDACHDHIRRFIPFATKDRPFSRDIEQAAAILRSRKLLEILREVAGAQGEEELFG
jgi:histidine ammonia-lyase